MNKEQVALQIISNLLNLGYTLEDFRYCTKSCPPEYAGKLFIHLVISLNGIPYIPKIKPIFKDTTHFKIQFLTATKLSIRAYI